MGFTLEGNRKSYETRLKKYGPDLMRNLGRLGAKKRSNAKSEAHRRKQLAYVAKNPEKFRQEFWSKSSRHKNRTSPTGLSVQCPCGRVYEFSGSTAKCISCSQCGSDIWYIPHN